MPCYDASELVLLYSIIDMEYLKADAFYYRSEALDPLDISLPAILIEMEEGTYKIRTP